MAERPWRKGRLAAATAVVAWCVAASPASAVDPIDFDDLAFRINLAAGYLLAAQKPDGDFSYEYDFVSGRYLAGDNIVRQAGAAFGLARYFRRSGMPDLKERVRSALWVLAAKSLGEGDAAYVAASGAPGDAPLGATALALIAELDYAAASGDGTFADMRGQWLRALRRAWIPGKGFAERPGRNTSSPYYDGEAWLALADYVAAYPDDADTGRLLSDVDIALIQRYRAGPDLGFFHWGALAGNRRHATTGQALFADFAEEQGADFLGRLRPAMRPEVNACYSVEGLVAVASALKRAGREEGALSGRLNERVTAELANSFAMQILPRQDRIDLGGGRYLYDPALAPFAGAFLNGRTRPATRIDFTQHCLLAMMGYLDFEKPGVSLLPR